MIDQSVKLNRLQFTLWLFGTGLISHLFDPTNYNPYPTDAEVAMGVGVFLCQMAVNIVLCVMRCNDIGINRWHSLWCLIPFANFYFMFRRGEAFYRKEAADRKRHVGEE